ncbi:MAG: fibronectin type III domain-containing protein [Clostridia bacterium]|nr:fibronectin type III domain-containing protein [Clostridia bacterium]
MKRLVFRIIPLLLVLTLALPALTAHAAMSRTEKENKYIIAVQALEDYLENAQEDLRLLAAIKSEFDALGGHAKSREFSAYTAILLYIAQDDFGYMSLFDMDMLARNQDFEQHLAKNYDDSPIGSVAKLRQYYDARSAEYDGDVGAAAEIYATLGSFFDAPQRYREIRMQGDREAYEAAAAALTAGDFAAAYFYYLESNNYSDAKARIENIELFIGYTPENAQDNPGSVKNLKVKSVNTSSVTLSWDKAAHATRYTVEYRVTGDSAWLQAGETANTSYPVNDLVPAQSYDFLVTAYSSGLKTTGAQLTSVLTAAPTPTPTPKPTPKPTPTPTPAPKVKVGDIVTFGAYEQDNNTSNGKEPIEWEVLNVESDSTCLLISRYALDCRPYNKDRKDVTWETCSLRSWLKNTFYNNAFNTSERGKIVVTKNKNANNPNYGTQGGNDTSDYVFLLSLEEIEKYYSIDKNTGSNYRWNGEDRLIKQPTAYAKAQGARSNNGACYWWLRSPGSASVNAARVFDYGDVDVDGSSVSDTFSSVVPAVRARLF